MALPTAGSASGPTMSDHIAESRRRHAEALEMGGPHAVDKHRASGRLPVRERIALLTDEGSWFETGALAQPERRIDKKVPGDGVVTGFGRIDGRTVGLSGASRGSRGADPPVEPFVALMRRYCIDYTSRHDLSVCDDIMVPGYTLHMGVHVLAGRDDAYKPAAAAQFRQFPGLCLTVNEIICSGDRLALRFTEHGASARHDGARAAWGGIGLYRWDGQRLLENHDGQDYFARRRQLAEDAPDPVEPPAVAPWDTRSVPPDPAAEAAVRRWLAAGDLTGVTVDDRYPSCPLIRTERIGVSALFSAGSRVAFHAVQHGPLTGEDPRFAGDGEAMLHLAGVVSVAGGRITGGRVIRDRLGLLRRLTAGDYRGSSPGETTAAAERARP